MNIVEFAENVLGLKLLDYQKTYLSMFDKDKCQECKKDWTKCSRCPVMMNWVKENKND